ncbi:MAG TPA: hypothetical protein VGS62_07785, partial [Streptosporangiaceae bacterium]|nr:hypothetical protein [Streptosporangiaceae bacterium]
MNGTGELVAAALSLGAERVAGLSVAERALSPAGNVPAAGLRERIEAGEDPLGEALAAIRGVNERRRLGQTLTPLPIVGSMVRWAADQAGPAGPCRVIDPGTGSARFLLAAGRRWPGAELVGVETDPVAALIARANLAAAGLAVRARVILADYRSLRLPAAAG